MNYIIEDNVDIAYEALIFLNLYYNNRDFEGVIRKIEKMDDPETLAVVNRINAFYQDLKQQYVYQDLEATFFVDLVKDIGEQDYSILFSLFFAIYQNDTTMRTSVNQFMISLMDISVQPEYLKLNDQQIDQKQLIDLVEKNIKNNDVFVRVLKLYLNFDQEAERFHSIIDRTVAWLSAQFNFGSEVQEFVHYWKGQLMLGTIEKELAEQIRMDFHAASIDCFTIIPSVLGFNQVSVNHQIMMVGILFSGKHIFSEGVLSEEEAKMFLKVIGDESKFSILKMIRSKPAYGNEIATELGLTTATISYHMSMMAGLGLVKHISVGNKIYYQLDLEILKRYLKAIESAFGIE